MTIDKNNPDELQRLAANPLESAWVAASAGSGKTKVLSDRVLNLLLGGTRPEKILCLTFTRTAAAQMQNKIAERLARWAVVSENELADDLEKLSGKAPSARDLSKARRLFAALLDAPGGLKVTTIHGFCQSLLKRFPLEAGVSPQFDVIDESGADELLTRAQNEVLTDPVFAPEMKLISSAVSQDRFMEVLGELTVRAEKLRAVAAAYPTKRELRAAYETAMGLPENATEESLKRAFAVLDAPRKADFERILSVLKISSKSTDLKAAAVIGQYLNAKIDDRVSLTDDYLATFLTKSGTPRANFPCKESTAVAPEIELEAERARHLREQLRSAKNLPFSMALSVIGGAIAKAYDAMKNAKSSLDYGDLIFLTRRLLEKSNASAWVLYKLDGGIDHILVDEAQDTSPDQWAIVRALADEFFSGQGTSDTPRTLFAVGDRKQSIFSFQGADPSEFEKMRAFFRAKVENAGQKWNDVPMYISFRSVPAVIDAVNLLMSNPDAADGVIEAGEKATHVSFRKGQAGLVELWPTEKPEKNDTDRPFTKPVERVFSKSAQARLAHRVAAKIRDMVIGGETLESENRPIRAGDIMILVRRRNAFIDDLTRELKTMNVSVSGADRLKITTHIAIQDLMVLGDFLLMPEDDLALATVLRSPLCGVSPDDLSANDLTLARAAGADLCGVSDNDLFILAAQRKDGQSLFDRLKEYADRPETALGKAFAFLKELLAKVDDLRPYELYSYVLDTLGRRKYFIERLGVQALDALDEFMSLALSYDEGKAPSLQNFLKTLRDNETEIKRDPEQAGFDAVRIMTVHASKGLQAPVVFLPDTCSYTPKAPKVVFSDSAVPVVLWAPKAEQRDQTIENLIAADKEKSFEEYRRLLYVAATRAADRLYVCGFDSKKQKSPRTAGCWYDLIAASFNTAKGALVQETDLNADGESILRLVSKQTAAPKNPEKDEQTAGDCALPDWIDEKTAPVEPTPPKPLAPSKPDLPEPSACSPLSPERAAALKRGTLAHALLEILPSKPAADREKIATAYIESKQPAFSEDERQKLANSVLKILKDPRFSELFGQNALCEVPVSGLVDTPKGKVVVNGKIDKLIVSDSDVMIVDYKTNRSVPADIQSVPAAYVSQMKAYACLLRQIYPDRKIHTYLLWTEKPEITDITPLVV